MIVIGEWSWMREEVTLAYQYNKNLVGVNFLVQVTHIIIEEIFLPDVMITWW
jgi:hypothetical protein